MLTHRNTIELAVLDMGGTTINEAGAVEDSFAAGIDAAHLAQSSEQREQMMRYVGTTMGRSKIDVFTHLANGAPGEARTANEAFEEHLRALLSAGRITPIPEADDAIRELQDMGIKVALATGFSRDIQHLILEHLGWQTLADFTVTRQEAGRGRPAPDMPLTALLHTKTTCVQHMLVCGDTVSDMLSGIRAGAGRVVGVESGTTHTAEQLRDAGATDIIATVADLPTLLRTES